VLGVSVYLHPQHRAGIVYSRGLRRCLIIFAPHTLILDRRTGTCRAPSLQLVWQRSKNFTSGAAIPFTPSSPLMPEGCLPDPSQEVAAPGGEATLEGRARAPSSPGWAPRPAQHQLPHPVDALPFHGQTFSHTAALGTLSFPRWLRWWTPVVGPGVRCMGRAHAL